MLTNYKETDTVGFLYLRSNYMASVTKYITLINSKHTMHLQGDRELIYLTCSRHLFTHIKLKTLSFVTLMQSAALSAGHKTDDTYSHL